MKLNLGCENKRISGYINVDVDPNSSADIIADLNKRFPFEDNTISEIKADDIIEHVDNPIAFLNECWRVLIVGGKLLIHVPHFKDGSAYFPEHKTLFSYCWFQKGIEKKYAGIKPYKSKIRLCYMKNHWTPLDPIANIHPRMWERLFWITGINVELVKDK